MGIKNYFIGGVCLFLGFTGGTFFEHYNTTPIKVYNKSVNVEKYLIVEDGHNRRTVMERSGSYKFGEGEVFVNFRESRKAVDESKEKKRNQLEKDILGK